VPTPEDKQNLLALLYEASNALPHEKAQAYEILHREIDRVRRDTPYSRQQVKDLLYKDGYREYAKRRRLQEQSGF